MTAEMSKPQPEKKFGPFPGGLGVAIWVNTIQTDDGPHQVRSYVAYVVMWRRPNFASGTDV